MSKKLFFRNNSIYPCQDQRVMPTIVEIPTNRHDHNSKIFNNSDETITYEPHNSRQTLINIYRTELKPSKPRFYYTVEQVNRININFDIIFIHL